MRIMAIGDSITQGIGDRECLGWLYRLPQIDDVQYFNLGVAGQTMAQILARAFHEVSARMVPYHDTLIIIGGGLNDLCYDEKGAMRTDPAILREQIDGLIEAMQHLAPTLVLSPFPIDEEFNPYFTSSMGKDMTFKNVVIEEASQVYGEICKARNVPYLNCYEWLKADASYLGSLADSDGIHPETMGYVAAAQYISQWEAFRTHLPLTNEEKK